MFQKETDKESGVTRVTFRRLRCQTVFVLIGFGEGLALRSAVGRWESMLLNLLKELSPGGDREQTAPVWARVGCFPESPGARGRTYLQERVIGRS